MIGLIPHCRICAGEALEPVLSLGDTPLANALLSDEDLTRPEARYPLDLVFCPECSLLQITATVPPEQLFSEYLYLSSYADTVVDNARSIVERLVAERDWSGERLVVELASNDGYLLQFYRQQGIPVLGIEPARNIAEVAVRERKVPTLSEFFTIDLARGLAEEGRRADVLHANNVLAHVADTNGFVAGIAAILADDGTAVIEVPYARDMIEGVEFDTIYHEHLCYFSALALDRLFSRHELALVDVERIPIHGGTLRLFVERVRPEIQVSSRVGELLAEERALGMDALGYYRKFGERVIALRDDLRALLARLKSEGKSIAVYGASAKGSTLLNFFGIGQEVLDFVADRSPVKQGRYTPGTRLPIVAPEALLERRPDCVLLLSWNFKDEIFAQQAEYRAGGGQFIVPIPELSVE